MKDPEEALMDVIAGELGFFDEIVRPHVASIPSFEAIDELRSSLCPEASVQASLMGLIRAWDKPCLLVEAEMALRKRDARRVGQEAFDFLDTPAQTLRAVRVTQNEAAHNSGLFIPRNMRVPEQSVIARVLLHGLSKLDAREDLSWWSSSDGKTLPAFPVFVTARRAGSRAQALITPRPKSH